MTKLPLPSCRSSAAEAKVIAYFSANKLVIYLTILHILSNAILTAAATVIETQIRTHGSFETATSYMSADSAEALLRQRRLTRNEDAILEHFIDRSQLPTTQPTSL